MVRLLSTISCIDCLHPDKAIIEKYNAAWWGEFIKNPWNNFDDVLHDNYYRNKENYYYCVALAADKDIINWYPRDVSPFCPGRFCGANLVKQGEVVQIIFNLKKTQTRQTYTLDRGKVQRWLTSQHPTSVISKNFTVTDRVVIASGADLCDTTQCIVSTAAQFDVYAKYCTWNLGECGMVDFRNIQQGQWPVAEINILMREGIMNILQADTIKPYDPAVSSQLLQYLYALNQSVSCSFDTDYDRDGIHNHQDNCPVTRNPSQKNADGDRRGDVCDEDIDGDGAINPQGLVNDAGFIDPTKYVDGVTGGPRDRSLYDNCPSISNPTQLDSNNDGLGDLCEWPTTTGNALIIQVTPKTSLQVPATVQFVALISGTDCGSGYDRTFGNGGTARWKTVQTTYLRPGPTEAWVIDCHGAIAYTSLNIESSGDNKSVGMQIIPNPMVWRDGFTSLVKPEIQGVCDTVGWSLDGSSRSEVVTKGTASAPLAIQGLWQHTIQAFCFDNNTIKGVSQANVSVTKEGADLWVSSFLSADNLKPSLGQAVRLKTTLQGADTKDIESVDRDFGDGTNFGGRSLNTIHIYLQPWVKIVRQVITASGKQMTNIIQLDIQESKDNLNTQWWPGGGPQWVDPQWPGFYANLRVNPLVGTTRDVFVFQLIPNNPKEIKTLLRDCGDWKWLAQTQGTTLQYSCHYDAAWSYPVWVLANLVDGTQAGYGGAVTVNPYDVCLQFIKKWGWGEKHGLKCDMDKDGVPDMCDGDIDGDGVPNPFGLVKFENPDCSLTDDNINTPLIENPWSTEQWNPHDNCPFGTNPQQANQDNDIFWDSCDSDPTVPYVPNPGDADNDGIPDHLDNLPSVPVWPTSLIPSNPNIIDDVSQIINNCVACPCGFTQTLSPVAAGDIIYSTMEYEGGKIKSNLFQVK